MLGCALGECGIWARTKKRLQRLLEPYESYLITALELADFSRFGTFPSLTFFVLHGRSFCERLEAVGVDVRVVDEQVISAAFGCDEAKPFFVIEPFHCTS